MKRFFVLCFFVAATASFHAAAPIRYRLSFPEPQHRWMQVEASFPDLSQAAARASHEPLVTGTLLAARFREERLRRARVRRRRPRTADDATGSVRVERRAITAAAVTVKYKVYGDRVDGTYLGVDTTHAHINMPAAIMWAHGLDDRPVDAHVRAAVRTCAGRSPRSCTPGSYPLEFTAPNLQYLMDSPAEFGPDRAPAVHRGRAHVPLCRAPHRHRRGARRLREGRREDRAPGRRDLRRVSGVRARLLHVSRGLSAVRERRRHGASQQHGHDARRRRSPASRERLLDTVAHEFFHCWNVERIRPKGLEPFDFDRANLSGELWLAEGFTQYYGPLVLQRAGSWTTASTARTLGRLVESVSQGAGAARAIGRGDEPDGAVHRRRPHNRSDELVRDRDLVLPVRRRDRAGARSDAARSLRRPSSRSTTSCARCGGRTASRAAAAKVTSIVRTRSTDAEATLAEVSGDRAFAHDFFARYIQGHDVADYRASAGARRLRLAQAASRSRVARRSPARVARRRCGWRALVAPTWPIYAAGLEQDDELQSVRRPADRRSLERSRDALLQTHKPGDTVSGRVRRSHRRVEDGDDDAHRGSARSRSCRSTTSGGALTAAQNAFRDAAGCGAESRCLFPGCRLIDAALGVTNFARRPQDRAAGPGRAAANSSHSRGDWPGARRSKRASPAWSSRR